MMDREEVIRMAMDAGFGQYQADSNEFKLTRFASLVAAAEREKAAQTCEGITAFVRYQSKEHYKFASVIAAAIRALT